MLCDMHTTVTLVCTQPPGACLVGHNTALSAKPTA